MFTRLSVFLCILLGGMAFVLDSQAQEVEQPKKAPDINLHWAAMQGNDNAVLQHILAGSDLNAKDAYGSVPLNLATLFGHTESAGLLIEAGVDLTIVDDQGSTPLHIAALFCRPEIVKTLLDKGANRYSRTNSGSTPYDIVVANFEEDKELYDQLGAGLGPLGLKLDYEFIKQTRPRIAEMLRPCIADLKGVDYGPVPGLDWEVSTPEAHGLDPILMAEIYHEAEAMENLFALLVIKDEQLIAEKYFNEGAIDRRSLVNSVSKSYISALVGIALEQGCISNLDQKMMDFFPEFADQISDPRKEEITVRDLLQMRAGYPWEELDTAMWNLFVQGDHLPLLVDIALVNDPGAGYNYSNLTSYLLGVIASRACDTDLKSLAEEFLLSPIESDVGDWWQDSNQNYYSFFGFTARDMARFGLLYLNEGKCNGKQVLSTSFVSESLANYSEDAWVSHDYINHMGRYYKNLGYGYQWWSGSVDGREMEMAWGHGGQQIVLLEDLNMLIVMSSDPLYLQHDDEAWGLEKACINLVGKLVRSLPKE